MKEIISILFLLIETLLIITIAAQKYKANCMYAKIFRTILVLYAGTTILFIIGIEEQWDLTIIFMSQKFMLCTFLASVIFFIKIDLIGYKEKK